jgi:Toprim-like
MKSEFSRRFNFRWLQQHGGPHTAKELLMRNILTLADLELNDPRSPNGRKQRRFLCPLCGSDKSRDSRHRSLCSNTETGAWMCHRCGERGLLGEYWNYSPRVLNLRPQWIGDGVFGPSAPRIDAVIFGCEFDWRRVWRTSNRLRGTPGEIFLERRGILTRFAESSGARFSAAWYGRPAVLFPVNDYCGNLVAVSGRFVDSGRHLKTQAAGRISLGVFSTPNALESTVIAVVEGPIDALSLALCRVPAVAMLGTSWAEWLPQSLSSKCILIATDADKAGDDAAQRLHEAITGHVCQALRLRPICGKDWNDVLARMGSHSLRDALRCRAIR